MIDLETGQLTIGELIIGPHLRRDDFISSPSFRKGGYTNQPLDWYMAEAKLQRAQETQFSTGLLFRGQQLDSVHLALSDRRFGTNWSDWSEKAELARKAAHDALLDQHLGSRRLFPWGSVDSVYDQKGGGSLIVIQYQRPKWGG